MGGGGGAPRNFLTSKTKLKYALHYLVIVNFLVIFMMDEIEMTEVVIEGMAGIGKNVDPTVDPTVEETTLVEMMIVIGPVIVVRNENLAGVHLRGGIYR